MKEKCYKFFETLGTELKIDLLIELKKESLSVTELAQKVNQERSKVSHALTTLLKCNFVKVEKEGKRRIYSLNKETILPLLDLSEEHIKKYCENC